MMKKKAWVKMILGYVRLVEKEKMKKEKNIEQNTEDRF